MYKARWFRWAAVVADGLATAINTGEAGRTVGPPLGCKPLWSDEFNYHGLPDPSKS